MVAKQQQLTQIPFETCGCTLVTCRTQWEHSYIVLLWERPEQPRNMNAMSTGLEQPTQRVPAQEIYFFIEIMLTAL